MVFFFFFIFICRRDGMAKKCRPVGLLSCPLAGGILLPTLFLKPAAQTPESGTRRRAPGPRSALGPPANACTGGITPHGGGWLLLSVTGRDDPAEHQAKLTGAPRHCSITLLCSPSCTNPARRMQVPARERTCYRERRKQLLRSFSGN